MRKLRKKNAKYISRRKKEEIITALSRLSERQKRARRKNWVQKTRKTREKKGNKEKLQQALLNSTTLETGDDPEIINIPIANVKDMLGRAGTRRVKRGRKIVNRNKTKAY